MNTDMHDLEAFLDLSAALTGFSKLDLQGTGQASLYLSTTRDIVGAESLSALMQAFRNVEDKTEKEAVTLSESLRQDILGAEKYGPIARNIIKLWYVGTWYELPATWRNSFGTNAEDVTFVLSPAAFTEGLLWPTLGVNPPAAKAQGYGSWAGKPRRLDTRNSG